jgi:hypothetical protein
VAHMLFGDRCSSAFWLFMAVRHFASHSHEGKNPALLASPTTKGSSNSHGSTKENEQYGE